MDFDITEDTLKIPFKTAVLNGEVTLEKKSVVMTMGLHSSMFSNSITLDKKQMIKDVKRFLSWLEK